uniref:Uncharacterized protein n=1 Tax=Panagrolaimus superbus TaxID=310955 RepID=A0A914Z774_9BILA
MQTFEELKPTKESYIISDLKKIKELVDGVNSYAELLGEKTNIFNEELQSNKSFDSMSSEVQNKRIRIQIYKRQIKEAKERLQNASNRQVLVEEVIENKKKTELELVKNSQESGTISKAATESTEPYKLTWTKLRNELIFRRRFMLFELYSIYFTDRSSGRRKERNCNCEKFDVIRGLHLPACDDRHGHNEIEITAALGHLTNILLMIGRILNYNFFSPIFHLFDISSRSHRERFVHAYLLLNRNIIQLRRDLGLNTVEFDRPIQNLQDAILCAIGKSALPFTQIMRCLSIHSPSVIIPITQNIQQNENNSNVLKNMVKLRSRDDNILDVVSAKNETFDIEKICSRSVS